MLPPATDRLSEGKNPISVSYAEAKSGQLGLNAESSNYKVALSRLISVYAFWICW